MSQEPPKQVIHHIPEWELLILPAGKEDFYVLPDAPQGSAPVSQAAFEVWQKEHEGHVYTRTIWCGDYQGLLQYRKYRLREPERKPRVPQPQKEVSMNFGELGQYQKNTRKLEDFEQ